MEVQSRSGDAFWISEPQGGRRKVANRLRPALDRLPLRLYPSYRGSPWSNNLLPRRLHGADGDASVQLVHLHWVGYGFVPSLACESGPSHRLDPARQLGVYWRMPRAR